MKNGHVIILDRYTRALILSNPTVLFAFGDNLMRVGYGDQAKEARGCANAVGIPTKKSPTEYLFDIDFENDIDSIRIPVIDAFVRLRLHLKAGGTIVWPKDGVGTGLARLPITGPRIFMAIEGVKQKVFSEAVSVTFQSTN